MPKDCICLACPNGCHLVWEGQGHDKVALTGQGCDRGAEFVRSLGESGGPPVPRQRQAYDDRTLAEIASLWGISPAAVDRTQFPDGSPERTLFRTVIEDDRGKPFILEKIPSAALYTKLRIIRTLAFLAGRGLAGIVPYCTDSGGEAIRQYGDGLWQLAPYIPGIPLDRETYLYEGWRADFLARFLIDLHAKSQGIPFFAPGEVFSLKDYIHTLAATIACRAPELSPRLDPVLTFLEQGFMEAHDRLPVGFCHGDYHPLNVVWGEQGIRAVIDWEFTGFKPEIYDLANLVGCLGVEHPSSLVGDLVTGLIVRLRDAGLYGKPSWAHFPAFVVALRFAWLSEWLRKNDAEMIDLELDYLDLLVSHQGRLRRHWGLLSEGAGRK
jgi:homoserine kinase type II